MPASATSALPAVEPSRMLGLRPLQVWLRQPLTDLDAISGRHDVVEALREDTQLRSDLRTLHLRGGCCCCCCFCCCCCGAPELLVIGLGCVLPVRRFAAACLLPHAAHVFGAPTHPAALPCPDVFTSTPTCLPPCRPA